LDNSKIESIEFSEKKSATVPHGLRSIQN